MHHLGELLRETRERRGMTQAELCRLLGWPKNRIHRIRDIERDYAQVDCDFVEMVSPLVDWDEEEHNLALLRIGCVPYEDEVSEWVADLAPQYEAFSIPTLLEDFTGRILYANQPAVEVLAFSGLDFTSRPNILEVLFARDFEGVVGWIEALKLHVGHYKRENRHQADRQWMLDLRASTLFENKVLRKVWRLVSYSRAASIAPVLLVGYQRIQLPKLGKDESWNLAESHQIYTEFTLDPRFRLRHLIPV